MYSCLRQGPRADWPDFSGNTWVIFPEISMFVLPADVEDKAVEWLAALALAASRGWLTARRCPAMIVIPEPLVKEVVVHGERSTVNG